MLPVSPPDAPPRQGAARLSADAWIEAGTQVLVDKSIDAVRVEVLAKELGVTKGSFYWHFKDREGLLSAILESWRRRATAEVIARIERREGTAQDRLEELLALPNRSKAAIQGAALELAIRAWARRNAQARAAVDAVDQERLRYTANLFSELGFDTEQAQARGFLTYAYVLGESFIRGGAATASQPQRRSATQRLLEQATGRAPLETGPERSSSSRIKGRR